MQWNGTFTTTQINNHTVFVQHIYRYIQIIPNMLFYGNNTIHSNNTSTETDNEN